MTERERWVRLAVPGDQSAVERLLYTAFGDEDGFLRAFFTRVWQRHAVTLACEGEEIAAMAALLACDIADGKGDKAPALYLYALATLPEKRGRGHAKALLRDAAARADTVFLHAADAHLQALYARLGWRYTLYARAEEVCAPRPQRVPPASLAPVDETRYFAAREALLQNAPHIVWPVELLGFHRDMQPALSGGLLAGAGAAAAVTQADEQACIREALGAGAAQGALQALGLQSAALLTPCAAKAPGALPLAQYTGAPPPACCHLGFDFN